MLSHIIKAYIFICISVLLVSCKSQYPKYIEIPVDRVRIEYKDKILRDSIIRNDSIIIKDKGDTVFMEKYKYLYKIREIKDTIITTDTITVVKTVEVTKEINKLHNWQIVLMIAGGAGVGVCLFRIYKLIKSWI